MEVNEHFCKFKCLKAMGFVQIKVILAELVSSRKLHVRIFPPA